MFPLRDSTPRQHFPFINYLFIILNIIAFILQFGATSFEEFTVNFAFIPALFNFMNPSSYLFILTSMFLHGGLFHILSNMWFLHIFGDNLEDRLGHFRYVLFYLAGGLFATLSQYMLDPASQIPMIGASGAVSAVAGAYFVVFRHSTVKTLIFFFFLIQIVELPVYIFLGYWFIIQLFSGVGSLVTYQGAEGGIAFFAHIGGFLFGYLIAKALKESHEVKTV